MIWKRTRQSHRGKQDSVEKADKLAALDLLQWSAAVGEIDLFYLDESGFCLWMPTEYSYFFQGEQKRLSTKQTPRKTHQDLRVATTWGELHLGTGCGQFQWRPLHHHDG